MDLGFDMSFELFDVYTFGIVVFSRAVISRRDLNYWEFVTNCSDVSRELYMNFLT